MGNGRRAPPGFLNTGESTDEEDNHRYQPLFNDHLEGVGVPISPCALRMRIEKVEVSWLELRFELKTH